MLNAIFNYNGVETQIQCNKNDTMKEIIKKYKLKVEIDNVFYICNGNKINEELRAEEILNKEDDKNNKMNIIVGDIENKDNNNIIESKEIICQICSENVIIKIEKYKIEMKCKNNHSNIILIKDYNNKKDISNIKCNKCNRNRSEIYNNELFICLKCNINLCPLCKSQHDNSHDIIDYEDKNYICNKHNENFVKYCCNNNICLECEKEHKDHKNIYFGDILPNIYDNNIKEYIDKLNNEIKLIIEKLNSLKKDMEKYYNIYNDIIFNYFSKRKNYEMLQNINEFINFNDIIIKDINEIINEKDINNKFKNIMNIYNKMNSCNYIISEIEVTEDNKDIKIINSYENNCREKELTIKDESKNEKEIKENIDIQINNIKIPFCYYYNFKEKGKYIIKYIIKNKLTNINHLFSGCNNITKINLSNFNTQNVTDMSFMFEECNNLKIIDLSNLNTENVTNISSMFSFCKSLTNINLSNFNTQKVSNMNSMFYECNNLTNIDLSNINTQNVTDMNCMFSDCNSLTSINLSNFKTENVSDMSYMFSGCDNLTNINLSNFSTQNIKDMSGMFSRCNFLQQNNIITNDNKILKELNDNK